MIEILLINVQVQVQVILLYNKNAMEADAVAQGLETSFWYVFYGSSGLYDWLKDAEILKIIFYYTKQSVIPSFLILSSEIIYNFCCKNL